MKRLFIGLLLIISSIAYSESSVDCGVYTDKKITVCVGDVALSNTEIDYAFDVNILAIYSSGRIRVAYLDGSGEKVLNNFRGMALKVDAVEEHDFTVGDVAILTGSTFEVKVLAVYSSGHIRHAYLDGSGEKVSHFSNFESKIDKYTYDFEEMEREEIERLREIERQRLARRRAENRSSSNSSNNTYSCIFDAANRNGSGCNLTIVQVINASSYADARRYCLTKATAERYNLCGVKQGYARGSSL